MKKQKNDFNLSLEKLFSSEPVNLLQQLFNFHLVIQMANKKEIISIWHTLNHAEFMLNENNDSGKEIISEFKESVKSRMRILSPHEIYDKEWRKNFESIVGSLK